MSPVEYIRTVMLERGVDEYVGERIRPDMAAPGDGLPIIVLSLTRAEPLVLLNSVLEECGHYTIAAEVYAGSRREADTIAELLYSIDDERVVTDRRYITRATEGSASAELLEPETARPCYRAGLIYDVWVLPA